MRKITKTCFVAAALLAGAAPVVAQKDTKDLYELSLEELMNVSIVSASKEKERLFDAPVTAYAVTREEISKAGVMSIPEALRLIPGVIVREVNNGNYDIHLRGFDNTARYTYGQNQVNTISLVMINNRPVFNYNMGGTFWESLPVDIADIERIEVVCGPSAPLFGPNAVTGVVNIITRDFSKNEVLVSGQLLRTMHDGSVVGSLALGGRLGEKLSVGLTGNMQNRQRLDGEQYMFAWDGQPGQYVKSIEYRKDSVEAQGLKPAQSLMRKGLNGYLSYALNDKIQFDYSAGIQAAEAQKVIFTTLTPTTYTEANSFYHNLSSKIHDISLRMSYVKGNDELHKLGEGYSTAYDYNLMDVTADYDIRVSDKLRIRPSLGYQGSTYSDLNRKEGYPLGGLINAERSMRNMAGSLRADLTPVKGLRLVGSGRMDKFDVNDDLYLSYQFAATYAFNDNWMARAVQGKSYSGIFYNSAFIDATIPTGVDADGVTHIYYAKGDTDIKATSNTLSELGLRANIFSNLQLDLTVFMQTLENVSLLTYVGFQQYNTQRFPQGLRLNYHQSQNLAYTVHQTGVSASLNWMPNKQWQIRPFVTLQRTESRNFDYYNNPTGTRVAYQGRNEKHESTPAIFGGWFINYSPSSKLNLNTSAYFYGDQTMYHQNDLSFQGTEGAIAGKTIINARASYQVWDKLGLFTGTKNLFNQNSREYYGTDRMGRQFFAGISYNL